MPSRHFHLRLNCHYQTEHNEVHELKVEILVDGEWKTLHLNLKSPGFMLLVYGLFACQHLYMRTNCAERGILLDSASGELKLVAGEFWNIQSVDVVFNAKIKSGQPSEGDIAYIIERMGHCPVTVNLPVSIEKKVHVQLEPST